MSGYHNNSIFWVETGKIAPNPFQPRREFEPKALEDLADSIRQYGVLQPLVVTRKEILLPDNDGMEVSYELIAGERRLRASIIAGLLQVPVIIRKETDNKVKLELAIIENLQREDLNPIDRAHAFQQLHREFELTHVEIGKRMGKSRVYVSNTLRLLSLPDDIKQGLMEGRISEGHTRPLLMLTDRPQEQSTLYKEIMVKKLSVRDAEKVARKIAQDRVRKKEFIVDPKIREFEKKLSENLGTRVHIEPKENGGQITIDYFTVKDLEGIIASMKKVERDQNMMDTFITNQEMEKQESLEAATSLTFSHSQDASDRDEEVILSRDSSLRELEEDDEYEINSDESELVDTQISHDSYSSSVIDFKSKQVDHLPEPEPEPKTEPEFAEYSSLNIEENYAPAPAQNYPADQTTEPASKEISFDAHHVSQDAIDSPRSYVHEENRYRSGMNGAYYQPETLSAPKTNEKENEQDPREESFDTQAGVSGATDAYYNPDYSHTQYEQYQQAPKQSSKRSFFGKLFG